MAKSRAAKEVEIGWLQERLTDQTTAILTDYRGLDVAEITELRRKLRSAGVEFRVVKNTLAVRAARARNLGPDIERHLVGPTAIAFSPAGDAPAAARELVAFARTHQKLQPKAGLVSGRVVDADGVRVLAELPSREVLLARVAGTFRSPVQSLAFCLAAPLRQVAVAVDQLRRKREAAA